MVYSPNWSPLTSLLDIHFSNMIIWLFWILLMHPHSCPKYVWESCSQSIKNPIMLTKICMTKNLSFIHEKYCSYWCSKKHKDMTSHMFFRRWIILDFWTTIHGFYFSLFLSLGTIWIDCSMICGWFLVSAI